MPEAVADSLTKCPNLQHVAASTYNINILQRLLSLQQLVSLHASLSDELLCYDHMAQLQAIAGLTALTELAFGGHCRHAWCDRELLIQRFEVGSLTNLQHLKMWDIADDHAAGLLDEDEAAEMSDAAGLQSLCHLKELRVLDISMSCADTNNFGSSCARTLANAVHSLPHLQQATLGPCWRDAVVEQELAQGICSLPTLRKLRCVVEAQALLQAPTPGAGSNSQHLIHLTSLDVLLSNANGYCNPSATLGAIAAVTALRQLRVQLLARASAEHRVDRLLGSISQLSGLQVLTLVGLYLRGKDAWHHISHLKSLSKLELDSMQRSASKCLCNVNLLAQLPSLHTLIVRRGSWPDGSVQEHSMCSMELMNHFKLFQPGSRLPAASHFAALEHLELELDYQAASVEQLKCLLAWAAQSRVKRIMLRIPASQAAMRAYQYCERWNALRAGRQQHCLLVGQHACHVEIECETDGYLLCG